MIRFLFLFILYHMERVELHSDEIPLDVDLNDDIAILTDLGVQLVYAVLQCESLENIKSLITLGAPVWYQEEQEGMSALHAAAYNENEQAVKFLIEQGAVWNASNLITATLMIPP